MKKNENKEISIEALRHLFNIGCKNSGVSQETCLALTLLLQSEEELGTMVKWMLEQEDKGYTPSQTEVVQKAEIIKDYFHKNTNQIREKDIPKWAKWKNRAYMPNYFVLNSDVDENIRVAEWGDAWAQGMLAMRYFHGQGVEQSYEKFAEWVAKAAEQGEPISQYILGWCYKDGIGVPIDLEKSNKWFKLSAEYKDKDTRKSKKDIDELFEELKQNKK